MTAETCRGWLAAALCLLLLAGGSASAQDGREIRGTVTNQTGGVRVGVTVALEDARGQTYTAVTDERGTYRLANLPPGAYTMTIAAEGFLPFIRRVTLTRPTTTLDVTLRVGGKVDVEVRPETPAIATDPRGSLSSFTLMGKDLEALADNPGLMMQQLREMAGSRGTRGNIAVYIDGQLDSSRTPAKDTIEMVRVVADPFAAEFAEPNQRKIQISTKPGSGSFNGDAKFMFRDRSLMARNAFAPTRPPMQYRNYSGYVGGPIVAQRWGFLLYGGRWEQNENAVIHATVLDPATSTARPFGATIAMPTRASSASARTDYSQGHQRLGLVYSFSTHSQPNQGLSGTELPEFAINRTSFDDTAQLSIRSFGDYVFNEVTLDVTRVTSKATAMVSTPAIVVLDAFSAGGNPGAGVDNSSGTVQITESLLYLRRGHTYKFGVQALRNRLTNVDRSGFGGTFTFGTGFERDAAGGIAVDAAGQPIGITPLEQYRRSLLGLPGYRPSQFSVVRGNPDVGVSQWQAAWFAQDDWAISRRLTFSYGLRHELQQDVTQQLNFAPRVSAAWSPDEQFRSAVRVGAGLFYNRVGPDLIFDTTRLDGLHQQELSFQDPVFFLDVPATFSGAAVPPPTIHTTAPNLRAPLAALWTASYERQLSAKVYGSVEYTWKNGSRLLRTVNVNAPNPQSGIPPRADVGPILQFESSGRSTTRQLVFSLRADVRKRVSLFGYYTLGWARSDTDGASTAAADPYDRSTEFGFSGSDERHQIIVGGSMPLPGGVNLNATVTTTSGTPFNISTGRDNNRDTLFTDRPAFANPGDPGAIVTSLGVFNASPQPGDRIIPRNFGRGTRHVDVSLHASKSIKHGVVFSVSAANILNRTNLAGFNGVVTSPVFSTARRALEPRRVQLDLRFNF